MTDTKSPSYHRLAAENLRMRELLSWIKQQSCDLSNNPCVPCEAHRILLGTSDDETKRLAKRIELLEKIARFSYEFQLNGGMINTLRESLTELRATEEEEEIV